MNYLLKRSEIDYNVYIIVLNRYIRCFDFNYTFDNTLVIVRTYVSVCTIIIVYDVYIY